MWTSLSWTVRSIPTVSFPDVTWPISLIRSFWRASNALPYSQRRSELRCDSYTSITRIPYSMSTVTKLDRLLPQVTRSRDKGKSSASSTHARSSSYSASPPWRC